MNQAEESVPNIYEHRPILLLANSSWYLQHYRSHLISSLKQLRFSVLALCPYDSSSAFLSTLLTHIPWRIKRSNDLSLISLFASTLKLSIFIRAIKPKILHSHTLKVNLITAFVSSIYGIPTVISFAGMGKLSKKKFIYRLIFICILKLINFFSNRQRNTRWSWQLSRNRTYFIFQNPKDMNLYKAIISSPINNSKIIHGSGVPDRYLEHGFNSNLWMKQKESEKEIPTCTFIYCGRLLQSKGIGIFLSLSEILPEHEFEVYGGIDPSSKDSLSSNEIQLLSKKHKNLNFHGETIDPLLNCNFDFPILVLPSSYGEGFPRSIVEAFSVGIPVICSQSASCDVFTKENIYLPLNNTPISYKDSFKELIHQYQEGSITNKIKTCFELTKETFSERKITLETIEIYKQLLENKSSYLLSKDTESLKNWLSQ
ncbi:MULTISPECIES: glycosyltransferase [unclassified Prochlorococcus]|uniref:glycosyltransferase n=1 Tax=unclassified Prochlorococcus TaxID=2627481 RepID=UPI000533A9B3|nr:MULTISPECIES: glycosyltransferase [unclassified Prochlorococcus]KGG16353.1 Glycosyltransferase [Prochlorococcus sp. MIT 0603]KGG17913.1 Glycosyltransferase [Prochlorococcus sp. MIT 0602]